MKLGIHCANLTWPGGPAALATTLAQVAEAADQGGVTTLTVMDHYFQMEHLGGPAEPMLEGYTTLGYLAGRTERLELGVLVTGVTYRHPGLLAKIVTTLDVLSQGRAMLGLGAAWYEREHRALGVPYPSTKERFERLEETILVLRQMFGEDDGAFDGKHYRLAETVNNPQTVRPGGPRLVIGGGGERKTLRLVAQYGDATNLFPAPLDDLRHKLDVLRRHCDDLGRDYDAISKTVTGTLVRPFDDLDAWLGLMDQYAALGIDQMWVGPDRDDPVGWTERMCDQVVPRLSAIGG
ncbi:LLM class F420-dependent oxidoreductase [Nocardioides islandensis]|uniref:LLM class F420-dependent oxidoreductase n=1 Tax=Nocardioides islandensis TaxID=433663 RepID=A0A930YIG2_9ACTN|nr:LLM class F420-dependent oxidoreductase [Nocardioides islandensis]MBF4761685.1 LLM class F420-dependent oxidoreductase [Nocardioides islandensis]